MFRNQYDSEVTLFNPEGKLLQLEYAINATKSGKLVIGIKSNSHSVISSLVRAKEHITKNINKILSINQNIMIGISGITGDGKLIYNLIENKLKEYEFGNNFPVTIPNIATVCSKFFHTNTIYSGTRPFGINILLAGYDKNGPNLFEINPDNLYKITKGTAIGKDSDCFKKIINNFFHNLENSSVNELLYYTLLSFIENKKDISLEKEIIICIIGKKSRFTIFNSKISKFLNRCYFRMKKN
jgi:20S proteasome subunit alpha 6